VSAVLLLAALAAPALSVGYAVWRQRGWIPLGSDAWFEGWSPAPAVAEPVLPAPGAVASTSARKRIVAFVIAAAAVVASLLAPRTPSVGPRFTASEGRVFEVADSMIRARGVDPLAWRRLRSVARDTQGDLRSFLRRHDAESVATTLAGSYAVPAWWIVRYLRPEAPLAERTEEWRVRVFPDGRGFDVRHVIAEGTARDSISAEAARRIALAAIDSVAFQAEKLREIDFVETQRPARRDVALTFVDTSIALPDDATARVGVSLAGSEVVAVRRSVQLPEDFQRQSRGEFEKALLFTAPVMLAAVALLIWGMVRSRRLPLAVPDELPRRTLVVLLVVFTVSSIGSSLLGLPSSLALYDSAVPWRTFLASVTGGQVMALVGGFVVAAFWLLANGMRRRAAIPLVSGRWKNGGTISNDLVAGLALGGIPRVTGFIDGFLQTDAVPSTPATALDSAAPLLTGLFDVIPGAVAITLAISIPALALYTFSTRPSIRWGVSALFLLLAVTALIGFQAASESDANISGMVWGFASAALFILGMLYWGRVSVLSWLLAALVVAAFGNLSLALQAPTRVEAWGGFLAMVFAVTLIAAGNWLAQRE
jgi:hypothetical protein